MIEFNLGRLLAVVFFVFAILVSGQAMATCYRISTTTTNPANFYYVAPAYGKTAIWSGGYDANRGILNLPIINVTDESFQPNGTLLGSSVTPFSTYGQTGGYDPEQVLFRCDAADEHLLNEIYSVNADNAYGGMYEDGVAYGINKGYATYHRNVVLRVKNNATGQYFSRLWQYRPLRGLDRDAQGRILVKAKNFTDVTIELFQIGNIRGVTESIAYSYNQPAAYIAFGGPGLAYPTEGVDHISHYPGWYANWPGNISLYQQLYTRRAGGCAVMNVTPYVLFPTVTIAELSSGVTREADIQINYRCQQNANINGPAVNANAIAFKIESNNYQMARQLGFATQDAVTYLVSNGYGTDMVANGVGVKLQRNDGAIQPFLNFDNRTSLDSQYNAWKDGWRPLQGNQTGIVGTSNQYMDNYRVVFGKLPGMNPTAGKFYAKAEVLIRVQ
ncbi:fimbrial protein [Shewanella putrefaciens]|nr:fimbrial protein [uncultured Shewanella sp.]QYX64580.1 fimbrial protein [Shewanella putrefaciens]